VYGNPCDVHAFETIRKEHGLKVIYDAAHAFGIKVDGQSVLNFGDASTLSFHATKVFHTIEGGAVVFADADAYAAAEKMTNFGIDTRNGSIGGPGINCKMSEAHAAMGLAVLDNIDTVLEKRQFNFCLYQSLLKNVVTLPLWHTSGNFNGAYFPILLRSTGEATVVFNALAAKGIAARRYFSPSINTLADYQYPGMKACVVSEDYASRTLCLPLYFDLAATEITYICDAVRQSL
jgi:dTDP-4-amino-4,6-dideoxygalactose transaminase